MARRVVITGMGTVTPHADDVNRLFERLCNGESAVERITAFDPVGFPSQVAAEVRYPVETPDTVGPYDLTPRAMRFSWVAAQRAIADAGLDRPDDDDHAARSRRAVHLSVGVGSTAMEALGPATLAAWGAPSEPVPGARRERPDMGAFYARAAEDRVASRVIEDWFLDQAAPALAMQLGAGRVSTAASACASGSHSILDAVHLIRLGHADIVLAGGVCTPVTRSMMPGFSLLSALTTRNDNPAGASRPFDAGRDGFIMAEGCSLMMLEDLDSAVARGARIHGEVLGVGIATDSYRLTDPEPTGRGMGEAMRRALADAGRAPADVQYINAHGTSTKMNDAAETRAVKEVFGQHAATTPMSSSKSMFGHLIHAAGVTEAIICTRAIQEGVVPPTINQETPDPDCDLDYVPNVARQTPVRAAMNNSFGFGGRDVSLILGAWDGAKS